MGTGTRLAGNSARMVCGVAGSVAAAESLFLRFEGKSGPGEGR
jgi:ATP-dependent protease HslVU (ClpYQ) peptidase subunit